MIKFSKSKFKKNQQSGFTFVETLVAVAVSVVVLWAVYSGLQSLFNIISSSRAKVDAVDLANEQN